MQRTSFISTTNRKVRTPNKKGFFNTWSKEEIKGFRPRSFLHSSRFKREVLERRFREHTMVQDNKRLRARGDIYYLGKENGEKILTNKPRIKISTIHKAKGGEADNVLLLLDSSKAASESTDFDSEIRTFYVGVTRAKKTLHLVEPKTQWGFKL